MKLGTKPNMRCILLSYVVVIFLFFATPQPVDGEDRFDFKTLYYQESGDRMQIISPTLMIEHDLSPTMTIKIDGIYNSISGATPSGAPPLKTTTYYNTVSTATGGSDAQPALTPSAPYDNDYEDHDDDDDDDDDRRRGNIFRDSGGYYARAGATPVAQPAPATPTTTSTPASSSTTQTTTSSTETEYDKNGKVPKSDVDDERIGFNLELSKRVGRHTLVGQVAYSHESDYISRGIAVRDSMDFRQKNTTLTLGASYANDEIDAFTMDAAETKDSIDFMVGLFQVLNKKTTLTVNATVGTSDGYLSDPYKVVALNDTLIPEKRPDQKDKQILYVACNRYLDDIAAAIELSYRYYNDSFGIQSHTAGLSLYQKIGQTLIIRPAIRYYVQGAADFYDVQFSGNPQYYSSDYRVSELNALGYGIKLIWNPIKRLSFDIAVDRYVQEGRDGLTADDVYPEALSVMTGMRVWL